jgi:putative endonuclease
MLYAVYILECADTTLYTGSTCDIDKRLNEHNNTKAGAKYTRGRRPVKLVYIANFKTFAKARKKEAEIKRLTREQKNSLIKNNKIN